jgi:hypothetical protein
MIDAQSTLSRNRLMVIVAAAVSLYFVGYGLQVVGWRLVDANGGNAGPFPAFFPQPSAFNLMVAVGLSAVAALLLIRRNAAPR